MEGREVREVDGRPAWRRFLNRFREPTYPTRKLAVRAAFLALLGASAVFGVMVGLMLVYSVNMPQMDELARYRPSTTTELYDIHGKVFGSFALERRVVVPYSEFPEQLKQAIFSIEDKNFETNGGINLARAASAAYHDVHSKGKAQGASTLTMQLARNLFLSSEKTYGRKIQEIFLTLQIERRFTKQQIFTLYANQIYVGRGTYGFEAASEYYFSKHVHDLTLPEAALLAALPKGPEEYSPVRHPERALRRRDLVLSEMLQDKKITAAQADEARAAPLGLHIETPVNTEAPYFVEEVRRQLEKEYGVEETHGAGLRVYTTLDIDLQRVANKAVLEGTATYERRQGWKGKLQNVLNGGGNLESYRHPDWSLPIADGSYFHALVVQATATKIVVKLGSQRATMTAVDWAWTQKFKGDALVRPGDVVYVKVVSATSGEGPKVVLEQDSGAQASLMAVDNSNGEVLAMVGGRDFALSQFNRATQAQRQVGSSFKPYVYTTAIEAGEKPNSIVVDAPTSFYTPNGPYTPHNYEAGYKGNMTLTDAFAESRNIPALRLANKYGITKVIATAKRFGITSNMPAFLPVAIGAADITLAEQVGAYSVFPNDGIRIQPHYIRKVVQTDGLQVQEPTAEVREVLSVDTARAMMILLQAVVQRGTGAAAASMKHALGGKTGTTNNYTDAWFIGFSPSVTCGTWIGFDDRESLGKKETGAKAALPMWMDFMKAAVAAKPNESFSKPNAPKKQLDLPAEPTDEDVPKLPKEDSGEMKDDGPEGDAAPAKVPGDAAPPPSAEAPRDAVPAPIVRAPASAPAATPPVPPKEPPKE
ncbi:MAG: PBP1A family penicillin-binding protein [Acidobacteriota bacterium]|nr:PBP1A family penicillin-binding protein [Acidobacteriota bacterium]